MAKRTSLQFKAEQAFKMAFRGVVEEHKRTGRPLVIWRNGKVVKVPASQFLRKREVLDKYKSTKFLKPSPKLAKEIDKRADVLMYGKSKKRAS